ncbi:MAG TPA: hypothetical protein RMH99_03685 [Sandaracinaceae bacterium LLY-WYZ-13_1]|nr:hypothetical protein [Sandaracinaceae bacterium LLY-WYZ-13_1]
MTEERGKLRVELRTPDGEVHSAEESLSDSMVRMMRAGERRGVTRSDRLALLDRIVERGTRLLFVVAGAVGRAFGSRK